LGDFSTLGRVLKITEVAHIFGYSCLYMIPVTY
jgi:hypothetical protein